MSSWSRSQLCSTQEAERKGCFAIYTPWLITIDFLISFSDGLKKNPRTPIFPKQPASACPLSLRPSCALLQAGSGRWTAFLGPSEHPSSCSWAMPSSFTLMSCPTLSLKIWPSQCPWHLTLLFWGLPSWGFTLGPASALDPVGPLPSGESGRAEPGGEGASIRGGPVGGIHFRETPGCGRKQKKEELGVMRKVQMVERGFPDSKWKALLCGQDYTNNFHKESAWEDARSLPRFVTITFKNRSICPVKAVFSPLQKTVMLARETEFRICVYGTKTISRFRWIQSEYQLFALTYRTTLH